MKIKNYFFTGLLAILPISLTLYVTLKIFGYIISLADLFIPRSYYMVNTSSYFFNLLLTFLGYSISIISAIAFITLIGAIALNYFGKLFIETIESIISKIPLSRTIYTTIKQISEVLFSKDNAPYKKVVMVEYPNKGLYSIGFLTNENISLKSDGKELKDHVSVFIPTSPNPTSGFLVVLEKSKVKVLNISIEDAAKLIISAGAIKPSQL